MNENTGVVAAANPWSGETFWFPGWRLGGVALILGPLLMFVGVIFRLPHHYFSAAQRAAFVELPLAFPLQLAAYETNPSLMVVAYAGFLAGPILMWPAIMVLVRLIGATRPGWALWGGMLTIFGIFARVYWAGVDHFGFQLVDARGLELATQVVGDIYRDVAIGPFRIPLTLAYATFFGWPVLAIGAYLSGTFGWFRCVLLAWPSMILTGVLKATSLPELASSAVLCVVLVPLGVQVLRGRIPGTPFSSRPDRSVPEASETLRAAASDTGKPAS